VPKPPKRVRRLFVVTMAKLRTHSSAGERQFSHKPASAIRPPSASASGPVNLDDAGHGVPKPRCTRP
jgi:hypothetical protein